MDADFPLLIGSSSLEAAKAVMDMGRMSLSLPGLLGEQASPVIMVKEESGHYSVEIMPPNLEDGLRGIKGCDIGSDLVTGD